MLLKWSEKYSVHNEIIDVQHRKLMSIVNGFSKAIAEGKGTDHLDQVLEEMSTYAWMHFHTEEDLLFKSDYAALAEHKQLHDEFKRQLMHMTQTSLEGSSDALAVEVHKFLFKWLNAHILEEDVKYANSLR